MIRCTAIAAPMISLAIRFKSASVRIRDVSAEGVPQQNSELAGLIVYAVKEINHYSRLKYGRNCTIFCPVARRPPAGVCDRARGWQTQAAMDRVRLVFATLLLYRPAQSAGATGHSLGGRTSGILCVLGALCARSSARSARDPLLRRLLATRSHCPDVADRNDDQQRAEAGDERQVLAHSADHRSEQIGAVVLRQRRRAGDGGSKQQS